MSTNANGATGAGGAVEDEQAAGRVVVPIVRRGHHDWRQVRRAAEAKASAAAQKRRARVLAHSDLAARLTQDPIGYARPEQWNGYVPPRTWGGTVHREYPNDSPRRAALVELAAEALRREPQEVTT